MPTFDLTQLSDDELRAALFYALVERLDAKALEDPSIAMVNRMPAAFAVSRRGNLFTLTQGIGLRLLRGDLKWKDHRERPRTFHVGRTIAQSRLAIMPDRIEGTPDEILDRIVAMFLEWTDTEVEGPPALDEPVPESQPIARVPQSRAPIPEAVQQPQERPTELTQERQPVQPRSPRESEPVPVEVTEYLPAQIADKPKAAEAPRPGPTPLAETTRPLRTYQLLFETTRRELYRAETLPASSRYSLIGAGVFVAFTAEAFFNDLGSRVMPSWSQLQRLDPREKAEVLSIELFNAKVDWSTRPFSSVAAALGFRRALAHAHAETLSFELARTPDGAETEVPRTRRTAWQEHCDVATIQRWTIDIRLVIEHFSKAYDPTDIAIGMGEQSGERR